MKFFNNAYAIAAFFMAVIANVDACSCSGTLEDPDKNNSNRQLRTGDHRELCACHTDLVEFQPIYDSESNPTLTGIQCIGNTTDPTNYSIDPSQPWGGVIQCGVRDGKALIYIQAGYDLQADTATWFKNYLHNDSNYMLGLDAWSNKQPSKLFYAVNIPIVTFEYSDGTEVSINDFMLGMGEEFLLQKNWWMGSPNMYAAAAVGVPLLYDYENVLYENSPTTLAFGDWCLGTNDINVFSFILCKDCTLSNLQEEVKQSHCDGSSE